MNAIISVNQTLFILIKKKQHMQNKRWIGECESRGGQRIGNGLRGKSRMGLSKKQGTINQRRVKKHSNIYYFISTCKFLLAHWLSCTTTVNNNNNNTAAHQTGA